MGKIVVKGGLAGVLGAAALSGMACGWSLESAYGDEVAALRQQLVELQRRVNALDAVRLEMPAQADYDATSLFFTRGSELDAPGPDGFEEGGADDRGLTIHVSPSGDATAAHHQVALSGFVKGNLIYDFDDNLGDVFNVGNITTGADNGPRFRIHARHTRLRLKSKSQTSVGVVRTYIEGDFFGAGGNEVVSNSDTFRLRHAWADWDMTDNFNFGVGQTWSNFMSGFALPPSVDVRGPAGRSFIRQGQMRLTYTQGPWLFAVAAENPETDIQAGLTPGGGGPAGATCNESSGANPCGANDRLPDFTARLFHKTEDNHKFQISGVVRELRTDADASAAGFGGTDSVVGWGILGAASFDFSPVTARVQATYGDGIGRYGSQYHGNRAAIARDPASIDLETVEAFSLLVSATVNLTDHSKLTAAYGRVDFASDDTLVGQNSRFQNVYVNWLYRPVSAIQFGAEANWGERTVRGGGQDDAIRFGLATWFYF